MDYDLVGACLLMSRDACKSLGYELDEYYVPYPILVYSKDESLDEGLLFFEIDDKMRYIPSHLILERYSIKSAKDIYPELFL